MAQRLVPFRPRVQGPLTDQSAALEGLRSAQYNRGGLLPDSELFRLASRDPETVAPGANAYWGNVLNTRLGEETRSRDFERSQQEQIQGAMTAQHPAVAALAQATAEQKALPERYGMEADLYQQRLANEGALAQAGVTGRYGVQREEEASRGRIEAAQRTQAGRKASRDAVIAAAAVRQLQLQQTPIANENDEARAERIANMNYWMDVLDKIRQGQYFSEEDLMQELEEDQPGGF